MGQAISTHIYSRAFEQNKNLLEHHVTKIDLVFLRQSCSTPINVDLGRHDVKESSVSLNRKSRRLSPLCVAMLTPGVTHWGHKLILRISAQGIYTGGCYFVGEDMFGIMVEVGAYDDKLLSSQQQAV